MSNRTLWGGNITLHKIINQDYSRVVDWFNKLGSAALVGMVDEDRDIPRIAQLQRDVPGALIIGRRQHPVDGAYHLPRQHDPSKRVASPVDVINQWGAIGTEGRYLYLINEPDMYGQESLKYLRDYCLEAIEYADKQGVALCLLNPSTGTPSEVEDTPNGIMWPVIKALSTNRRHIYGRHEYHPTALGRIDRVGRHIHLLRACQKAGIAPPRIVITEFGYDNDVAGQDLRGAWSRGLSEVQYANDCLAAEANVYLPWGAVEGIAVFQVGNSGGWDDFEMAFAEGFWKHLITNASRIIPANQTPNAPVQPAPVPAVPTSTSITLEGLTKDEARVFQALLAKVKVKIVDTP